MVVQHPKPSPSPNSSDFFASAREKRLWTWTLLAVIAIYTTLGLAAKLAETMYHQGTSAVLFLSCMLLVGLTILTQGLRSRPRGIEIGVGLGIAVVYFLLFFRLTLPERSHLIEYSVVAVFIYEALSERVSQGRFVPLPALTAILMTSLIGAIDEFIQLYLPSRVFDWDDILFNCLASLLAVVALLILKWARYLAGRLRK